MEKENQAVLLTRLAIDLKRKFKIYAAKNGTSMNSLVVDFIQKLLTDEKL